MNKLILAMLFAVSGCSSSATKSAGPCQERQGTYRIDYSTRSGSCGDLSEALIVYPAVTDGGANQCTGAAQASSDNCSVELDETCPTTFPGGAVGHVHDVGSVTWSTAGDTGSGTLEITLMNPDGSTSCTGSYGVTYTRQ